ncbi:MAG: cation:proton antiporter subunit C [Desulfurococcaceae archaeon]|jgi:multicomponent Na+:H+ antiporter subunit C|nr:cation:proton antiporter subunit C [Desulfurococcaceae archaeon]
MSDYFSLMFTAVILSLVANIGISLYGIFAKPSLVKKFIALTIFSDSINSFAIALGFRRVAGSYPGVAVLADVPRGPEELRQFSAVSVDPLPQALVLTAIVIGLAVYMFLAGLIMLYYRHYGTTRVDVARGGKRG